MLAIGTIVLGVTDPHRAAAFWMPALGYVPREGDIEDDGVILVPSSGAGVGLNLDVQVAPRDPYPQTHLDLYTEDQAGEVERLVSLGAERVAWDRYPDDPDFVVLADPEGNRFCVIDTNHP